MEATILERRLDELKDMIAAIRSNNFVSVKTLRTFTGKAQSIASLLFTWRPFVHMLYACIMADAVGHALAGHRWMSQIPIPLNWLEAFLNGRKGRWGPGTKA